MSVCIRGRDTCYNTGWPGLKFARAAPRGCLRARRRSAPAASDTLGTHAPRVEVAVRARGGTQTRAYNTGTTLVAEPTTLAYNTGAAAPEAHGN